MDEITPIIPTEQVYGEIFNNFHDLNELERTKGNLKDPSIYESSKDTLIQNLYKAIKESTGKAFPGHSEALSELEAVKASISEKESSFTEASAKLSELQAKLDELSPKYESALSELEVFKNAKFGKFDDSQAVKGNKPLEKMNIFEQAKALREEIKRESNKRLNRK